VFKNERETSWPADLGELRIGALTHPGLLDRAESYRRMAASATTEAVMKALLRLAERCEALAEPKARHTPPD
jgi:hypothetical protein